MVMTDPIADFLTRIRNANQAKHEVLEVPASNIKKGIAEILKREGFVKNVEYIEDDKQGVIRVFLKYGQNGEKVITGLKRVSTPAGNTITLLPIRDIIYSPVRLSDHNGQFSRG